MCDLQADVVACGPCGDVSQEVAQRLSSCKKLVSACFGTGVVAGCRQAKFPVLCSQAVLGHHGQGKLCQRLEAGNVCLGRLRELRVVPADLSHGPLLGKPAEFGGGADPSSYADGITVCTRVRGGHALQNGRLSERDNARMAEAGVQPMQAGAAVFAKVELVSSRVLYANPSFLVRAGHARNKWPKKDESRDWAKPDPKNKPPEGGEVSAAAPTAPEEDPYQVAVATQEEIDAAAARQATLGDTTRAWPGTRTPTAPGSARYQPSTRQP